MERLERAKQADQRIQDRAKQIYAWALENKPAGRFKKRELPGVTGDKATESALQILVSRGLLGWTWDAHRVYHYHILRVVDPKQCLAIAPNSANFKGVTIYKVDPGVAKDLGGDRDLRKHAIGEVVSC